MAAHGRCRGTTAATALGIQLLATQLFCVSWTNAFFSVDTAIKDKDVPQTFPLFVPYLIPAT